MQKYIQLVLGILSRNNSIQLSDVCLVYRRLQTMSWRNHTLHASQVLFSLLPWRGDGGGQRKMLSAGM